MQEKTNQRALWIAIFGTLILSFLGHFFIEFKSTSEEQLFQINIK